MESQWQSSPILSWGQWGAPIENDSHRLERILRTHGNVYPETDNTLVSPTRATLFRSGVTALKRRVPTHPILVLKKLVNDARAAQQMILLMRTPLHLQKAFHSRHDSRARRRAGDGCAVALNLSHTARCHSQMLRHRQTPSACNAHTLNVRRQRLCRAAMIHHDAKESVASGDGEAHINIASNAIPLSAHLETSSPLI
jgi:hypothetical protein